MPISDEMRGYCKQKGYPVAELDEWEEEEDYSSSSEEEDKNEHIDDDKDSSILKDLSEDELTDGEDIIEDTDDES